MPQHVCPWWLAYSFDNPLRRLFHNPQKLFAPYINPGMTVADIGCGMGYFALGLARLVGASGTVLAVDIQKRMLDQVRARAQRAGCASVVYTLLSESDDIAIEQKLDFVLAFWMLHETPDISTFMQQFKNVLKPQGILYFAEPRMHVSAALFRQELQCAQSLGFTLVAQPKVAFSYAAVFQQP